MPFGVFVACFTFSAFFALSCNYPLKAAHFHNCFKAINCLRVLWMCACVFACISGFVKTYCAVYHSITYISTWHTALYRTTCRNTYVHSYIFEWLNIFMTAACNCRYMLYIRGWSSKNLANKRKKKILRKLRFICQSFFFPLCSLALTQRLPKFLNTIWKIWSLEVLNVDSCDADNLLIREEFLLGVWIFQIWQQKKSHSAKSAENHEWCRSS